jgi:hypothetical protein
MTRRLALIAVVTGTLAAGVAMAQTPFGGDNEGFLPPNRRAAACENAIAKALAKALVCVAKCHQARAAGKLANETAEDDCESNVGKAASCKSKFNTTRDRLLSAGDCPGCLNQVAMDQAFAQGEAFLDSNINAQLYCAQ